MGTNDGKKTIKVIIADDQVLFASSLKLVLESDASGDFQVIGVARDGNECVDLLRTTVPDIILMDVRMPTMDGVEAAGVIHARHPGIKIMMLTTFDDDAYVKHALSSGATGYVLKNIEADELFACIRAVVKGTLLVSPSVGYKFFGQVDAGHVEETHSDYHTKLNYLQTRFPELKRREAEVLYLILQGRNNTQIAQTMYIAEQTVRNYTSSIYDKIGVDDRFQAMQLLGQVK
jgi:DNA-binding NarL/FixJ family response regulator